MAAIAEPDARVPYTRAELMTIVSARALGARDVVFVGIGLPNLACNLAKRLHAPDLELVYESGVVGAAPERQAVSIGDPCLVSGAASICSLADIFLLYLHRGLIDVGFLGGAQVDRFGNINTTVVGSYERPKIRLPGSGGASEIAVLAKKVFIVGRQTQRTFVERVDFVTSPGRLPDGARPPGATGGGPELVFSDLGVYDFGGPSGEMRLRTIHPGVTEEELRANTGWGLDIPAGCTSTRPPSPDELRILREELDPKGYYLEKG